MNNFHTSTSVREGWEEWVGGREGIDGRADGGKTRRRLSARGGKKGCEQASGRSGGGGGWGRRKRRVRKRSAGRLGSHGA